MFLDFKIRGGVSSNANSCPILDKSGRIPWSPNGNVVNGLNPVFPFDCNYFCHQIQRIRPQYIVDKLELLICVLDSLHLNVLING